MSIRLSAKGMEKLGEIQAKYKFMNTFELEQDDVDMFCSNIMEAYYLGLCLDNEDVRFIVDVLEKING